MTGMKNVAKRVEDDAWGVIGWLVIGLCFVAVIVVPVVGIALDLLGFF